MNATRVWCHDCDADGSIYGIRVCDWHASVREMRALLDRVSQDHRAVTNLPDVVTEINDLLARVPEKP